MAQNESNNQNNQSDQIDEELDYDDKNHHGNNESANMPRKYSFGEKEFVDENNNKPKEEKKSTKVADEDHKY